MGCGRPVGHERPPEQAIEAILRDRTGRECLFVPSGRMALYMAFRTWLTPGDRLLMSPVTDDVIFFVALAAGLRPVMAPLARRDGNIQPEAVDQATWSSLAGVLTTNLYGLPDQVLELRSRCQRHGVLLIEDAAHAIETEIDGRPVGAFGPVAAFSLAKHVGGVGGVLAFSESGRRQELVRLRDADGTAAVEPSGDRRGPAGGEGAARRPAPPPPRRACPGGARPGRTDHPPDAATGQELGAAVAAAPDLDRFDPWVRFDLHSFRMAHPPGTLRRTLARLRGLDDDRARRLEGVLELRAHDAAHPRWPRDRRGPCSEFPCSSRAGMPGGRAAPPRHPSGRHLRPPAGRLRDGGLRRAVAPARRRPLVGQARPPRRPAERPAGAGRHRGRPPAGVAR